MMQISGVEFVSVSEAAEMLDCSPTTIRRWIDEGRLSSLKNTENWLGKHHRIPKSEINDIIDEFVFGV